MKNLYILAQGMGSETTTVGASRSPPPADNRGPGDWSVSHLDKSGAEANRPPPGITASEETDEPLPVTTEDVGVIVPPLGDAQDRLLVENCPIRLCNSSDPVIYVGA